MASIQLESVYLSYPIYSASSRSLKKSLLGVTGGKISADEHRVVMVEALRDINLHLSQGDRVGLIGSNGAGKSTLLRTMAGIYEPTAGRCIAQGKIGSILNMSLGMDEEATGYENILIRGLILGLDRKHVKALIPDIEEFTELAGYLNMPVRTYSSGMKVRLAFAISTSIHPEILLVDEVIGAGDANFFMKAEARMAKLLDRASVFVLATHDNGAIKKFCNKAAVLEHGTIKYFGPVDEILKLYEKKTEHVLGTVS